MRITALAVPPDFERSRAVFVAWSEPSPGGGEMLNITRYRELAGTLGEGATIVNGLPLPPNGTAPMAVDDAGFVYVALPVARASTDTPDIAALEGFILRFDFDGGVPPTNPSTSPVWAHGYSRPAALVWEGAARVLWLAGTDPRWPSPVSWLAVDAGDGVEWPRRPLQVAVPSSASPSTGALPLLTVTTDSDPARTKRLWLVQGADDFRWTALGQGQDSLRLDPLSIEGLGPVAGLADGPDDSLTVIRETDAGQAASEIWLLTPVAPGLSGIRNPAR
jgi:hypothetical protein